MLNRQGARAMARAKAAWWSISASRTFSGKAVQEVPPPITDAFKATFKKVAPTMTLPHFPSQFMKPRPPVPDTLPAKVTVNFVLPYKTELDAKEVDMVIVPATSGQMGILPGHVPTIAELKPGIMSVHEGSDVKEYFVSGGFAFVHPNCVADITVVDAYPLDVFDAEEVKKGLAEFTQKSNSASTDSEKAEAQIGVEVHSALSSALGLS